MVQAELLDLAALLAPIDEGNPSGTDIREDAATQSLYYDLKTLRQELQRAQQEQLLEAEGEPDALNWPMVVDQASTLLTQHSKDIEVACWLVEALSQLQGFAGFTHGIIFLNRLLTQYEKSLYPREDDDEDVSVQCIPIAILNGKNQPGTLVAALNLAPLFVCDDTVVTAWDIHQSAQSSEDQGSASHSLDGIKQLALRLSPDAIAHQKEMLVQAAEAISELDKTLTTLYGRLAPSLNQLTTVIKQCQRDFSSVLPAVTATPTDGEVENEASQAQSPAGTLQHRQAAQAAIESAIEYYQHYEPHSPVLLLLQRALRWQNSDLLQIFDELMPQEEMRFDIERVFGVSIGE